MGNGGTEAFPDLGEHCDQEDCKMLDFLPFTCDGCDKVFCVEHRTYKSHSCPKAYQNSRIVVVCDVCSTSIEKKAGEEDTVILEQHKSSRTCDPSKKNKAKCPMKRCKELLTFSNTSTCKICNIKVCLRHRFPSDHDCKQNREKGSKFPVSFPARSGTSCSGKKARMPSPSPIKAC